MYITGVVEQYEQCGPGALAPNLVSERQLIQPLLQGSLHRAHHRDRLFRIAARMSGQLSYMATNLGQFDSARAYGVEAFTLADHVNDDELRAWVRGTQSLAEYYVGSYDQALELARDGRRYAGHGRQAVRLAQLVRPVPLASSASGAPSTGRSVRHTTCWMPSPGSGA